MFIPFTLLRCSCGVTMTERAVACCVRSHQPLPYRVWARKRAMIPAANRCCNFIVVRSSTLDIYVKAHPYPPPPPDGRGRQRSGAGGIWLGLQAFLLRSYLNTGLQITCNLRTGPRARRWPAGALGSSAWRTSYGLASARAAAPRVLPRSRRDRKIFQPADAPPGQSRPPRLDLKT